MISSLRFYRDAGDLPRIVKKLSRSEIDIIIESLQKEAKLRDENTKKELENGRSGISIIDFVTELPLTARVKNALLTIRDYETLDYIDDVTKEKLLSYKNSGKKSWQEIIDTIHHSLQGTRFEDKQSLLKKHFEK
jgi:DNA-directed RNA polymerase alpha subunit